MGVKYLCVLSIALISFYAKAPQEYLELLPDDYITVHNQTTATVHLLIYNVGEYACPVGFALGSKVTPQAIAGGSKKNIVRPYRQKKSKLKCEDQKLIVSAYSSLLGYTMTPEGLNCFPMLSMSGFLSKRKKHFYITEDLLASNQFGKLTIDSYKDDSLKGECYRILSEAVDKARSI